jgi:hypothetical protein
MSASGNVEIGKKFDSGKARISLLQGYALEQVMKVAEMGAIKYGDHNYRLGMSVTKFLNAAFRHAFVEWLFKGIDNDPESGLPHLAHAAWNILSALEQMILKPEFDDRYRAPNQNANLPTVKIENTISIDKAHS